ncbi:MAG: dienelactone hydrolase family protein [Acidimicrobiales bacterium]|nr:dienelactone hydrolase family protein [Acidimicrobiales bacterium]
MTIMTGYEQVSAGADGAFDAYCSVPDGGRGPGVLVFQEIFGINDNMRALADRLAEAGYVALVPDMFWRLERRFERNGESQIQDAFAMIGRYDFAWAGPDIAATHAHLVGMDACTGSVGAVGFCFGGTLAFAAAALSEVDGRGIDAAVSYYGSATNEQLDLLDRVTCPLLFHYGDSDPFIPLEKVVEVERAAEGRPDVEVLRYPGAGHAFSNADAPSMYRADAAELAWSRTLEHFATHLT